jgi:hypothetical protein
MCLPSANLLRPPARSRPRSAVLLRPLTGCWPASIAVDNFRSGTFRLPSRSSFVVLLLISVTTFPGKGVTLGYRHLSGGANNHPRKKPPAEAADARRNCNGQLIWLVAWGTTVALFPVFSHPAPAGESDYHDTQSPGSRVIMQPLSAVHRPRANAHPTPPVTLSIIFFGQIVRTDRIAPERRPVVWHWLCQCWPGLTS